MSNIHECNALMLEAIRRYRAALRDVQTKYTAILEQGNPGPDAALELATKKLNGQHQYFLQLSRRAMLTINKQIMDLLTYRNANSLDPHAPVEVPAAVTTKGNISSIMQTLENYEVTLNAAVSQYDDAIAQQAEGPITVIQLVLKNLNEAHVQFMSVSEVKMPTINEILTYANLVDRNAVKPEPIGLGVVDGSEEHHGEHAVAGSGEEGEQDVDVPEETGKPNLKGQ